MRSVRRSVGIFSILAVLIAAQLGSTFAASETTVRSPPSGYVPEVHVAARAPNLSGMFRAIAELIESRTGLTALESLQIVMRLGCLIAQGATSALEIHTFLTFSTAYSPVSLEQAIAISSAIASYQEAHPILFELAQQTLQRVC